MAGPVGCGSHVLIDDGGKSPREPIVGEAPSGCPARFDFGGHHYRLTYEDAVRRTLVYREVQ
jgi:hypothetical protein